MIFNKKIIIQKKTVVTVDGKQKATWADFFTAWANVNGLFGSEYWAAVQQKAENTVVFAVRWCKTLDVLKATEYRIMFNNQIYDIKHIDNVQFANRELKIKAVSI